MKDGGGKLVRWRERISSEPSHLTDIDNEQSVLISALSMIKHKGDPMDCFLKSHCSEDPHPLKRGSETLFINAAMEGSQDILIQPPWVVDIELPAAV
ncbi:hypothetical protein N7455_009387 [Penicillium solitum]|uniref:uncharacterized protein n=1 Tax=Penicillium solitum TaxID=60172 RepID=UPI0017BF46F1|nr:hypothetical protein HAV15_012074 [Penicillium sp. str. \